MESAEQPTKDLFSKINPSLKRAGHQAAVNPNDESDLDTVKRDVRHLMGSALEEGFGGAGNSVNDRSTKGRVVTLIGDLRRKLKAA